MILRAEEQQSDKTLSARMQFFIAMCVGLIVVAIVFLFLQGEDVGPLAGSPETHSLSEEAPVIEQAVADVGVDTASDDDSFAEEALAEPEKEHEAALPLPELNHSDAALNDELSVISADALPWVTPTDTLRKFVRAVENINNGKLVHKHRPFLGPEKAFHADKIGKQYRMSPASYRRYDPYVNALVNTDVRLLAALYRRYYPLLQEAYLELGMPASHFNGSLLGAIDHLLQAPVVEKELLLIRPSVAFKFSDSALESLPAAHKLMLRMGPENTRRVQQSLQLLRQELAK